MIRVFCPECGEQALFPEDMLLEIDGSGESIGLFYCPVCGDEGAGHYDQEQTKALMRLGIDTAFADKGYLRLICSLCELEEVYHIDDTFTALVREKDSSIEPVLSGVFFECPTCLVLNVWGIDQKFVYTLIQKGAQVHYTGEGEFSLDALYETEEVEGLPASIYEDSFYGIKNGSRIHQNSEPPS